MSAAHHPKPGKRLQNTASRRHIRSQIVKRILYGLLLTPLVAGAGAALPGDSASGQRLHDANCVSCHDTSVYTRTDRSIRSLDALKRQVAGCTQRTKRNFSAAETQSIVKYLNERFYHFN